MMGSIRMACRSGTVAGNGALHSAPVALPKGELGITGRAGISVRNCETEIRDTYWHSDPVRLRHRRRGPWLLDDAHGQLVTGHDRAARKMFDDLSDDFHGRDCTLAHWMHHADLEDALVLI